MSVINAQTFTGLNEAPYISFRHDHTRPQCHKTSLLQNVHKWKNPISSETKVQFMLW